MFFFSKKKYYEYITNDFCFQNLTKIFCFFFFRKQKIILFYFFQNLTKIICFFLILYFLRPKKKRKFTVFLNLRKGAPPLNSGKVLLKISFVFGSKKTVNFRFFPGRKKYKIKKKHMILVRF